MYLEPLCVVHRISEIVVIDCYGVLLRSFKLISITAVSHFYWCRCPSCFFFLNFITFLWFPLVVSRYWRLLAVRRNHTYEKRICSLKHPRITPPPPSNRPTLCSRYSRIRGVPAHVIRIGKIATNNTTLRPYIVYRYGQRCEKTGRIQLDGAQRTAVVASQQILFRLSPERTDICKCNHRLVCLHVLFRIVVSVWTTFFFISGIKWLYGKLLAYP